MFGTERHPSGHGYNTRSLLEADVQEAEMTNPEGESLQKKMVKGSLRLIDEGQLNKLMIYTFFLTE